MEKRIESPYLTEGARILLNRTEFRWNPKYGPDWGGHRPDEIQPLITKISKLIGITPKQANQIKLVFGDHEGIRYPYRFLSSHHVHPAFTLARSRFLSSKFKEVEVVINRSLEVAAGLAKTPNPTINKYKDNPIISCSQPADAIRCEIVTSWENIIATIAEELKHAQTYLLAGDDDTANEWEKNYVEILTTHSIKVCGAYSADIFELTASRVVCRILEVLTEDENRRIFFRHCYQKSLREWRHIDFPVTDLEFYVLTNFPKG